ncbi:protein CYSTEINE-RICH TRANSMEMBRANE MODULE 3 [Capsicum annuum]
MSSYNQNEARGTAYAQQQPQGDAFVAPPPPAGYPTRDVQGDSSAPVTTQSKGDGFWKGWLVFFYLFSLSFSIIQS